MVRKVGSGWTHVLGSSVLTSGRFRVLINDQARSTHFSAAVNVGVVDESDKPNDVKENYIVWINSTDFLGDRAEGFFWNGTMDGDDTGGYREPGIAIQGISPLALDVIVEDRILMFSVNGGVPVVAFENLPKVVRPYIFMYGKNEVTYIAGSTFVLTVRMCINANAHELDVVCTGLAGDELFQSVVAPTLLIRDLNHLARKRLQLDPWVGLQLIDPAGVVLDNSSMLGEIAARRSP